MATSTGRTFHQAPSRARATRTMAVAMDPGPARSGIASGTIATSSLAAPAATSPSVMRVLEGCVRIMSSARRSSTTPPAILKAPMESPSARKIQAPPSANARSTAPAVTEARRAVARRFSAGSSRVIARKNGTAAMGSTTKNSAVSDTSPRLRASAIMGAQTTRVSGGAGRLSGRPGERREADRPHLAERLEHDPPRHLRAAHAAILEEDRHLRHAEARADGAGGELELEGVARALDGAELDRLEHLAAEALEAAGEVPHVHAEDGPRVEAAASREDAPPEPPVHGPAARHVARAEHEVHVARASEQGREVAGVVGEVGVHLEDEVVAALERPGEAGQVRLAQALLPGPVE